MNRERPTRIEMIPIADIAVSPEDPDTIVAQLAAFQGERP